VRQRKSSFNTEAFLLGNAEQLRIGNSRFELTNPFGLESIESEQNSWQRSNIYVYLKFVQGYRLLQSQHASIEVILK